MQLAAVTMVYNDPDYMDPWCRHYAKQVGARNCYVIDHGSDDGTTDHLGEINVIRLPRSPKDEAGRARLVSSFCTELLRRYDAVIHVDVDELLVADPRYHRNLADCAMAMKGGVLNAIGLEVWHRPDDEPAIDIARPISEQRRWLWFNSALCKPALIREPVTWPAGFHSVAAPVVFEHLYMFHLRYFDRDRGLRRLAQTRGMAWADAHSSLHQRGPDQEWLDRLNAVGNLPEEEGDVEPSRLPLAPLLEQVIASQAGQEAETYRFALNIHGRTRLVLPPRFRGRF
jgi:Glycosyl transferase family 2